MKKSNIIILLIILMGIINTKALAHDIEVVNADGKTIYYVWANNKTELSVSYIGKDYRNSNYSGSIVIPESIDYNGKTYYVTSIGESAFYCCWYLTSVDIPNGVTSIGEYAFTGCHNLTSIKIPNSVKSIGKFAFSSTGLTSFTIPNNVTSIGNYAFSSCSELTCIISEINQPFKIDDSVFNNLPKYACLIVPKGKKTSYQDLAGWKKINIVELGEGGEIGQKFESDCLLYTISENNTDCILVGARNVSNELVIPSQITFNGKTYNVTSIDKNALKDYNELTSITIPSSVTSIGDYAFQGCSGLTSITIPNSVTSIGKSAFEGCTSLTSITIPTGTTQINESTFFDCSELTSVIIHDKVISIGEHAFAGCKKLTSVFLPKSIKSLAHAAFGGANLTNVYISDLNSWFNISFPKEYNAYVFVYYNLFLNGNMIKELEVPEGITTIENNMFDGCNSLESVIIHDNVTSIGRQSFARCKNLKFIQFGKNVKAIWEQAFYSSGITSVDLPEGLGSVSERCFAHCSNLTSVKLPSSLVRIALGAFEESSLKDINLPDGLNVIEDCAFSETFISSVLIPNSVYEIGFGAFRKCPNLAYVLLPDKIKTIPRQAFQECSSLTKIDIPNSVTSIEDEAFCASGIQSVRIGSNICEIQSSSFANCKMLEYVIVTSDKFPKWENINNLNCQFIVPNSAYYNGFTEDLNNFITYSYIPRIVKILSVGATSANLEIESVDPFYGYPEMETSFHVNIVGLTPEDYITWSIFEDEGIVSVKTDKLVISTQEPKPLSSTKARLIASTEEADDMIHFGFEWRRIDAPDMIASSKVSAPLYNGTIVGTLNNLKDDVYYKYRPFYKSDSGETFYGEWMGLFTGDADVYFEPEVYTKDAEDITKVSALLAGVWFEGTDDFEEKGFEYWTISNATTRAVGADVKKVTVSGNTMTTTLDGLKAGATYGFRSYAKTASGTTYGEEKTFKTKLIGDVDGDGELTKADAKAIADHIVGNTPAGFNKKMADVNEDGKINAVDIVMLINIIK